MVIGAVVQDLSDSGSTDALGWWAILAAFLALGLVWYFTGWPFGPRGR